MDHETGKTWRRVADNIGYIFKYGLLYAAVAWGVRGVSHDAAEVAEHKTTKELVIAGLVTVAVATIHQVFRWRKRRPPR